MIIIIFVGEMIFPGSRPGFGVQIFDMLWLRGVSRPRPIRPVSRDPSLIRLLRRIAHYLFHVSMYIRLSIDFTPQLHFLYQVTLLRERIQMSSESIRHHR